MTLKDAIEQKITTPVVSSTISGRAVIVDVDAFEQIHAAARDMLALGEALQEFNSKTSKKEKLNYGDMEPFWNTSVTLAQKWGE